MIKFPYEGTIYISSPFGNRVLNGKPDWHAGLDLVGQDTKTILAPCNGKIISSTIITDKSNLTWQWGNYIRLDTNDGYSIFMCHMSKRLVEAGTYVKAGQPIGIEGTTGYSFGSHCHFEIRKNGQVINPCPLLGIQNAANTYHSNTFKQPTENKQEEIGMTKDDLIKLIDERIEKFFADKKEEKVPDWAKEELEQAIALGITDGSRPMQYSTRMETAIMVKRGQDEKEK